MASRKRSSIISRSTSSPASRSPQSADGRTRRRPAESAAAKRGRTNRRRIVETLENRQLLAGPQLIGIQPNEGELIVEGSIRDTSPRTLTLSFNEGQTIDADTLSGIRLVGAGADGTFGGADDNAIVPAAVEVDAAQPNEVIVRFSDPLPDDRYQLRLAALDDPASGVVAIRNIAGDPLMVSGDDVRGDTINFTLNLGAQIRSVVPQPVIRRDDGTLTQNRNEITVYFNEDPLFTENEFVADVGGGGGSSVRIVAAFPEGGLPNNNVSVVSGATTGASFDDATGLTITVAGGTTAADVAAAVGNVDRFSASVTAAGAFAPGAAATIASVPTERSAENPRFYQLLLTRETIRTTDDSLYFPERVEYDRDTFTARLFFAADLNELGPDADGNAGPGLSGATYRLRIGTAVDTRADLIITPQQVVPGFEAGSTLETAFGGGDARFTLGTGVVDSLRIEGEIDAAAAGLTLPIEYPGGDLTAAGGFTPDVVAGVPTIFYNFDGVYEQQGGLNRLNQINAVQRQRIREVLELYQDNLGVQFVERVDDGDPTTPLPGITFAVGGLGTLNGNLGTDFIRPTFTDQPSTILGADIRIDPTFDDTTVLLSNAIGYDTTYGGDFTRRAAAAVGLALGLSVTPDAEPQNLLALNSNFITAPAPSGGTFAGDLEPVFPSATDVFQGRNLYRPDANDVDLYRFEVAIGDEDRVGAFTAETFAERLPDASSLDTTLTLFREVRAFAETDFGLVGSPNFRFEAVPEGKSGNDIEIRFVRSSAGNTVQVFQARGDDGNLIDNGIVVQIPRSGSATVGDVINAIRNNALANSLFTVELLTVGGGFLNQPADDTFDLQTVELSGGGAVPLVRNDDYFSEDSRITATLTDGIYYVGVTASGNDTFDPVLEGSSTGGRTEGAYQLNVTFEPQVDEVNILRDLDGDVPGVPGTPIDGDADGSPRGEFNFWFQTRSLNRAIDFTTGGAFLTSGQTLTVTDLAGRQRTYQFVRDPADAAPGNVAVRIRNGVGTDLPANIIASNFVAAFNSEQRVAGEVTAILGGTTVEFTGIADIETSQGFEGIDIFGRTIFVDKLGSVEADGSLSNPYNNIANPAVPNAVDAALPGDIIRIVGNGGADGDITTESDNLSYRIGVANIGGRVLEDGRNLEVPQGVTVMIDGGSILKFRNSRIGVGSTVITEDRSGSAVQVLGTPRTVDLSIHDASTDPATYAVVTDAVADAQSQPLYRDGSVILTSLNDTSVGTADDGNGNPNPGDWGGIEIRRDLDATQGRADLEDEGIFMQTVVHGDIIYGGGSRVLVDSQQRVVNPVSVFETSPTVAFNNIRFSADAAVSASPDSFLETSFASPRFQVAGEFTPDYERVGPEIVGNLVVDNSINGLFVRVTTTADEAPRELTVSGRFDDTDIVHFIAENLIVSGNPGGVVIDPTVPSVVTVTSQVTDGGTLVDGDYSYRLTFVDAFGASSAASDATPAIAVNQGGDGAIRLSNLPPLPAGGDFVARRLYRSVGNGPFEFVSNLNATDVNFTDIGTTGDGALDASITGVRGRPDGSLVIDPAAVLKFRGTRIELGFGSHLYAEGLQRDPVVFTSFADDRFGAGGTFDTNNDDDAAGGESVPARGDWAGLYASPTSTVSLDNAVVAYGGGVSLLPGGVSRGFAALELQQAVGRVTNSTFEFNDNAQFGAGPIERAGRLGVTPATVFVRGSQPVLVANDFRDNRGTTIDIDIESLTAERIFDTGRQTEFVGAFTSLEDNFGPLIRLNRFAAIPTPTEGERQLSGLEVRGGRVGTDIVLDDTDVDHLVFDQIVVDSNQTARLISRAGQSLVVKLSGSGSPYEQNFGTGFTATGSPRGDASDRGGAVQIVGVPGSPVVLTSLFDDTVGSAITLTGAPLLDTGGDGASSRPEGNDWRSVLFDRYSHDRNVDFILEETIETIPAPGLNGNAGNAQFLGQLAESEFGGDENLRLGFEVQGFLSADRDVDVYSFEGSRGSRVFIDIDDTSFGLDAVVELLDQAGNVLARSDNSTAEVAASPTGSGGLEDVDVSVENSVSTLTPDGGVLSGGAAGDEGSLNPLDAGLSVVLPGLPGGRSTFFVRVRSDSTDAGDADGGQTNGGYRLQVRLTEDQEIPGSVVRFADIRYANHGVHLVGLVGDSPLVGDAAENEGVQEDPFGQVVGPDPDVTAIRNDSIVITQQGSVIVGPAFANTATLTPQYVGDLAEQMDGTISIAGALQSPAALGVGDSSTTTNDVDIYRFDVGTVAAARPVVLDIDYADGLSRPNAELVLFYDPDGDGGSPPRAVAFATDGNVLDDLQLPGDADPLSVLTRGSSATGDPFIGPLTLVPGTYYVGVLPEGSTIEALASPLVRREPVESLTRIFDDGIQSNNFRVAGGPSGGRFLDLVADEPADGNGFVITTQRSGTPGHQIYGTFNNSRFGFDIVDQTQGEADTGATTLGGTPRVVDEFGLAFDPNVGDEFVNTSQVIPNVTIAGQLVAGPDSNADAIDIYEVTLPIDGQLILDIDFGAETELFTGDAEPPDTIFIPDNSDSIDLSLFLFDSAGTLVAQNDFSPVGDGEGGSVPGFVGSLFSDDPFISENLPAGTYRFAVGPDGTTFNEDDGTLEPGEPEDQKFGTYLLQVSVEGADVSVNDPGNESVFYDRSLGVNGELRSRSFDLSGYSAADLPSLYFDYLYLPAAGDSVSVVALVDGGDAAGGRDVVLASTFVDAQTLTVFRQSVVDLGSVAGEDDVRIEFRYANGGGPGGEGLYLDNFVVGFAERGELVTGAGAGQVDAFAGQTLPGEYQLEIRPASRYTPNGSAQPAIAFDTNTRLSRSVSLIAPAPDQVADGDTFSLTAGTASLTFEFDTGDGNNTVTAGNIRIPIGGAGSADEIADSIRGVINGPLVTNTLGLIGSDRGGGVTPGTGLRGDEVALNDIVTGDFIELGFDDPAPPGAGGFVSGGNFRLAVRYFDLVGDTNDVTGAGVSVVDSNVISDVRAVGVYSEPGERDRDPQTLVPGSSQPFTELAPLGNSAYGAAKNLPTLNNAILGGFAPGPSIVNNTIDQAGYAGIKSDGAARPMVIDSPLFTTGTELPGSTDELSAFGEFIPDGLVMIVDAANTRVVFEFEDIGGGAIDAGGSGELGGDGFADGHVPIYYSFVRGAYNPGPPSDVRQAAHTRFEVMHSIYQSILGSTLVTNGLVNLVNPSVGSSPFFGDPVAEANYFTSVGYPNSAVYVEGATGVYFDSSFQKVGNATRYDNDPFDDDGDIGSTASFNFFAAPAPVSEVVQPTTRVINNTLFGADGTPLSGVLVSDEANDTIATAQDLPLSFVEDGRVVIEGSVGDNANALPGLADVDVYRVDLTVGDRLIVDIDTDAGAGIDTSLQLLDENGDVVAVNLAGVTEDRFDPIVQTPPADGDPANLPDDFTGVDANEDGELTVDELVSIDPTLDFLVERTGTYYLAVSASGNERFDPTTIDGRQTGVGQTGPYVVNVQRIEPRSFVISLDNDVSGGFNFGSQSDDGVTVDGATGGFDLLAGQTMTVRTVEDLQVGDVLTNEFVFEFVVGQGGNAIVGNGLPTNPFQIPIGGVGEANDLRVPDVIEQVAEAVRLSGLTYLDRDVEAYALGGEDGVEEFAGGTRGLAIYRNDAAGTDRDIGEFPQVPALTGSPEFQDGFGHNRTHQVGSIGRSGRIVDFSVLGGFNGTTELYVLMERIADIEFSDGAVEGGFGLDPVPGSRADQLLPETGLMLTGGSSATVLNNVFSNLHQPLVREATFESGFSSAGPDLTLKPADVIVSANTFQYDPGDAALTNPLFRRRSNSRFDSPTVGGVPQGTGITNDAVTGPSNINGGDDDFNVIVGLDQNLLVNPDGNNFLPTADSVVIDSSIDTVTARPVETTIRTAVGISPSNIAAPRRDVNGVLRVDNPDVAPPPGLGGNVFIDRGSNERADFVGPIANILTPLDNDAEGIDIDPAVSFLEIPGQNFEAFRVQLRDVGDSSDPFRGLGVDDSTVVVSAIPGVRNAGANVTLFENERLLTEGVDYDFRYDETQNVITLRSLAGVFRSDRSYRIRLNNGDSTVVAAAAAAQLSDGQRLTITDTNGAEVVLEIETGLSLSLPEPLTAIIPTAGLGVGGVNDGDLFSLGDAEGNVVTFEFDTDGTTLSGGIATPIDLSGVDPASSIPVADQVAAAVVAAVNGVDTIDIDARLDPADASRVVFGGEDGSFLDTAAGGLDQDSRTLALLVPSAGVASRDGDTFTVNDGSRGVTFELDTDGVAEEGNVAVNVTNQTAAQTASALAAAIRGSGLAARPAVEAADPETVRLGLPVGASVDTGGSTLRTRGVTRNIADGDTFTVSGTDTAITLEFDRDDTGASGGLPGGGGDGVADGNLGVDFGRAQTSTELAAAVFAQLDGALRGQTPIDGLDPATIEIFDGGTLLIGGDSSVVGSVRSGSLSIGGTNGVTEGTSIGVRGDVRLAIVPGQAPSDGNTIQINGVTYEFIRNGTRAPRTGADGVTFTPIFFTRDTVGRALATAVVNAIGGGATIVDDNTISLGNIPIGSVNLNGVDTDDEDTEVDSDTRTTVLRTTRTLIEDGETFTIRSGGTTVTFEFESSAGGGGVSSGNRAIAFAPVSTFTDDPNLGSAFDQAVDAVIDSIANAIDAAPGLGALDPSTEGNRVVLGDRPGVVLDLSGSPSLNRTGVAGGATPVRILPTFGPEQVKEALVQAINSVTVDDPTLTPLRANDSGGGNLIVSGGLLFDGPLTVFNLPAIADVVGNPLEPNREDGTTQFTIVPQSIGLDFGDAPDPREDANVATAVPGRYATLLTSDGPRHIVDSLDTTDRLTLGSRIDVDADGLPSADADGDDTNVDFAGGGTLFGLSRDGGVVTVRPDAGQLLRRDGETFTILTGGREITFEYDIDGRFGEDIVAIRPAAVNLSSVLNAIASAVNDSVLGLSATVNTDGDGVEINADDEDGVSFDSFVNPGGLINRDVPLAFDVTVGGAGLLEGWIDFNADGDFDDPGEQVLPMPGDAATVARREALNVPGAPVSNVFAAGGGTRTFYATVPGGITLPSVRTETYARFRVSREGGLEPDGLALSGEVEDYVLTIDPTGAPVVANPTLRYTVPEDGLLQALDADGGLTPPNPTDPSTNNGDNGVLVGVTNPGGGGVRVIGDDVGPRQITGAGGAVLGTLEVFPDGTFTFDPTPNYFGPVSFELRVQNAGPNGAGLAAPFPIQVNIDVTPVNDAPTTNVGVSLTTNRTSPEDEVINFTVAELITDRFRPGPENESGQTLLFASAGDAAGRSTQGGSVQIVDGGATIRYIPPADDFGVTDTFTYTVRDVPPAGQTARVSGAIGTVNVTLTSVNDGPRVVNDSLTVDEGMEGRVSIATLLSNDTPGPRDEIDDGQTLNVDSFSVDTTSGRGGSIRVENGFVIYQPPAFTAGVDQFTYTISDNLGTAATGTVIVNIIDDNNAPRLTNPATPGGTVATPLSVTEAGSQPRTVTFDLTNVFNDPDGDPLTFTAGAADLGGAFSSITVSGDTLTAVATPFANGEGSIVVSAVDSPAVGSTQSFTATIPLAISAVNNAPTRIGSLDPLSGTESQTVRVDLTTIFQDRDGANELSYRVSSFGDVTDGTASQIGAAIGSSPLIDAISFEGNQLTITPVSGAFGSVDIAITATDGVTSVVDDFTLTIDAIQDPPTVDPDAGFNVPVGAELRVTSPAEGLLQFASDLDGDAISVVPTSGVLQGQSGTLQVFADGTFVYSSDPTRGSIGDRDVFNVNFIDATGLQTTAEISFTLTASRYQNPIATLNEDVTADGLVTPIDALRVLNLLRRNRTSLTPTGGLPVDRLGFDPPDYPDVNGDGVVTPIDALAVLNRLRRQNSGSGGEAIGGFEAAADAWSPAATITVAAADVSGFETRVAMIAPVSTAITASASASSREAGGTESIRLGSSGPELLDLGGPAGPNAHDSILAAGLEIERTFELPPSLDYDAANSAEGIVDSIADAALLGWGNSDL